VYLTGVDWERLTLAEYKAEQAVGESRREQAVVNEGAGEAATSEDAGAKLAAAVPEIDPSDYESFVERMLLDVLFETKEHLDVTTADGQDQSIVRDSSAIWRFESLVTQPDDVDWKIVSVS